MKYKRSKNGSYIHNCLLIRRPNDGEKGLFIDHEGDLLAALNGYAIIPLEEYCKLKNEPFDSVNIDQADNDLFKSGKRG